MSKRTFAPRSRQFNERQIERTQSGYASGMTRDLESNELDSASLANLINGRAYSHRVEGRPGTELLTPADWGVTITDEADADLATAMADGGEMYAASGRDKDADTIPAVDSIFMVYGDGDTADDALATAKGEAVRKYDIFQVGAASTVTYLGSIRFPALEGYGDTVATELTASKSGTTITVSAGPALTSSVENYYFEWGDGTQDYISDFTDGTHIEVLDSGTKASTSKCRIRGVVNASSFHESEKRMVFFVGEKLYLTNSVPWYSFTEIPLAGGYYYPDNSFCKMYEFKEDLIMINANGFYRIKLDDDPRYWRINEAAPLAADRPADVDKSEFTFFIKRYKNIEYRYLYAHSRIKNTSSFVNNRIDVNSTLEWQSGPIKSDTDGRDYFKTHKNRPIGPEHPASGGNLVQGVATDPGLLLYNWLQGADRVGIATYDDPAFYQAVADGSINVTVDVYNDDSTVTTHQRTVGLIDCTNIKTLEDVAFKVETAFNQEFAELNVRWRFYIERKNDPEEIRFVLISETPGIGYLELDTGGMGTDLSTPLGFGISSNTGISSYWNAETVGPVVIPSTLRTATHISLYRTQRLDEVGIRAGNNENQFILVDDVPLVNVWIGDVVLDGSDYYYEPSVGTYSPRDVGNDMIDPSALGLSITNADPANNRYRIDGALTTHTNLVAAIGCSTVMVASASAGVLTIASGYSLTSADEGKAVWFASGKQVWITKVLTSSTAEIDYTSTISITGAAMNPTSRYISDTVLDQLYNKDTSYPSLQPRIKNYSLPTRFTEELPNCNIGEVVPGWIFGAVQGENVFYYSDTAKDYLAGSYAADLQYNDRIDSSIQELIQQNDYLGIRSEYATWRLNLATVIELGDASVGENIDGFNDPEIVDNSVGVEGEGGTAVIENGNFMTFTSEPSVREFNMHKYGVNLTHDRIQESDIQKLKPNAIMMYDHILGLVLWGEK